MIEYLRDDVKKVISASRFNHTLGVEVAAVKIGIAVNHQNLFQIQSAALLHDITKEYSFEKQLKICDEFGIILRNDEIESPQILHAITAAAIIPCKYPQFASENIISAVRWHTTGRKNMTLSDKIIYLSDYIEDGRKHDSCIQLREMFWNVFSKCQTYEEKISCINGAIKIMLSNTIDFLNATNVKVNVDTIEFLNDIQRST